MFKKILVPLDGSELSERAISYASQLAGENGRVMLLRATMAHRQLHGSPTAEADAIGEAEFYLKNATDRYQGRGPEFEWHTYYGGASEAIQDEVRLRHTDAIVMSTHGRSGIQRLVYGSVAEQVVNDAIVPVLLVPARCDVSWPPAAGSHILVPLDGTDVAEAALEPAIALAQRLHLPLRLLWVVEPVNVSYYSLYSATTPAGDDEAEPYLADVVQRLQARQLGVSAQVERGHASEVIANFSGSQQIAAVVMATHGRGGIARLVLGSVTAGVLHQASVPVLVVRPLALARVPERAPALQLAS